MSGFNAIRSRSLGPSVLGVASREMDDLFDRLFYPSGNVKSVQWMPPISVWEEGDHYCLEMDLPGLEPEEIEVTFQEGSLKISGSRSRHESEGRKYLQDERCWGDISRLIAIPDSVDPDSIEANYDDGVLRVELAKRPEVMPKKIEIATK